MSYASDNLTSLSFIAVLEDLPSFETENLDTKYICVECRRVLSQPWQTPCGHRICKSCLDELFSRTGHINQGIPCPASEEGCEEITRDKVYPDFSAVREMKQLPVKCKFREYGCPETMPWMKLKDHLILCRHRLQPCHFCQEEIASTLLEHHVNTDCPMFLVPCPFGCQQFPAGILRRQLESHKEVCPARPRSCPFKVVGCSFKGTPDDLVVHESDNKLHLEIMRSHLATKDQENIQLKGMLQEVHGEISLLKSQLHKEMQEKTNLTNMVGKLKEEIVQLEQRQSRIFTGQAEQLAQVETKVGRVDSQAREISQLKVKLEQQESKISQVEKLSKTSQESLPDDFRTRFGTTEKAVSEHKKRADELDMRTQCLETTNYDGVLIWKICNYSRRKQEAVSGRVLSLYSQPFYTSRYGYKMCARVYLNGDGTGRGECVSLFFVIMQGDYDDILSWPFRQKVTLTLMDQKGHRRHHSDMFRPDPTSSSYQKPTTPMNVASGCPRFIEHKNLEDGEQLYLNNDTLYFKIVVDITDLFAP